MLVFDQFSEWLTQQSGEEMKDVKDPWGTGRRPDPEHEDKTRAHNEKPCEVKWKQPFNENGDF